MNVNVAHSHHQFGAEQIGAVLYSNVLQHNPKDPKWLNRDRFVLSGGHGSMFLYSWLHLSGYDLPLEEVKNFRQHHSMTPGHPEFPNSEHNTPGIEATTGPLGQGVVNAAGIAAAQKMEQALFNTKDHTIFDSYTYALCGDGCLQEGVSAEGAAFAAHEGLDNLVIIYDSNDVTLDKMAEYTQSEDTAARYEAYGWEVVTIDGHDLNAVQGNLEQFKKNKNGKPKLLICKTIIGKGIDEVAGTNAAHGEAGVKYVAGAKAKLGLTEPWQVSKETYDFFKSRQNVRTIKEVPAEVRRNGVLKGAYILKKETGPLKLILIASGSEVGLAWQAAEQLGEGVRVVSIPSTNIFDRQPQAYKDEVLPLSCRKRVSVEAGVGSPFYKYVGLDGKVVSVERFGFSAPGDIVFRELGMTVEKVVEAAKSIL